MEPSRCLSPWGFRKRPETDVKGFTVFSISLSSFPDGTEVGAFRLGLQEETGNRRQRFHCVLHFFE